MDMKDLLGKVCADRELRTKFLSNPLSVVKEYDIGLASEQEKALEDGLINMEKLFKTSRTAGTGYCGIDY